MSDFTINETMAKIIYDLSDREIYNDVRAELGTINSEIVVDEDPTYEWKVRYYYSGFASPGECSRGTYYAEYNALSWKIEKVYVADFDYNPYYDYTVKIVESDSKHCVVESCNTGDKGATMGLTIKYKYKTSEGITHEEITYNTLTVRATDDTSIAKYGRRVLPLVWPQGANQEEMQMIANANLARYKDPMAILHVTIQGGTDALATQIFTREISDVISVISEGLGMASTDFYLDKISIRDGPVHIPICNWMLTGERPAETAGYFVIDTDFIDGDKLIG